MDIFEYADSINWNADYYDWHTGYIYHIAEMKNSSRNVIRVSENGIFIGQVTRE